MPSLSHFGNLQVLGPQMNVSSDEQYLTGVDREGCADRHPDSLPCFMSRHSELCLSVVYRLSCVSSESCCNAACCYNQVLLATLRTVTVIARGDLNCASCT